MPPAGGFLRRRGPPVTPPRTVGASLMNGVETLVLFAAALLLGGAFTGIVAGLLGVGGGIVIVPVLYYILPFFGVDEGLRMHLAVGTSLATIIPTSIASARAHNRRGAVDFDLLTRWAPAIIVGVVGGALAAGPLKGQVLSAIFAAVALVVALNMARGPDHLRLGTQLPGRGGLSALGLAVGFLSTLMGIGGGTLSVPLLTLYGYPIRRAVGTAAAIGLIIAIPGAAGFWWAGLGVAGRPPFSLGYINLLAVVAIVPTTVLFSPLGARLAHSIDTLWLRRAFALFLALTAGRMIVGLWE